jgi:hypothetical protein|tara:strand:- start:458 stop:670 length:213 start_codon:yes stop_codon:yes gene_type:complete
MKNLFKNKAKSNTEINVKLKLTLFEIDLIRTSLIHSINTSDWELEFDKDALEIVKTLNNELSKYQPRSES